jgi:1,4-alpha-glucan branching enzyme
VSNPVLVILNFSGVARFGYRVGVTLPGFYQEVINTDARIYGGSGGTIIGELRADLLPHLGYSYSLVLDLPPLTGLILTSFGTSHGKVEQAL